MLSGGENELYASGALPSFTTGWVPRAVPMSEDTRVLWRAGTNTRVVFENRFQR